MYENIEVNVNIGKCMPADYSERLMSLAYKKEPQHFRKTNENHKAAI